MTALGWGAAAARGQILVDHPPHNTGGRGSDTDFFSDMSGARVFQQAADNFRLASSATIGRVDWWGFYGGFQQNHQPPAGDERMRLRLYDARPSDGLPGLVLYEQFMLNPSRTPTGRNVFIDINTPEFLYQAPTNPFTVQADTDYWVEIVQVGDVNSHFRWEDSAANLTGFAFVRTGLSDWQHTGGTGDLAFRLYGVPEPVSGTMGLVVAFIVIAMRLKPGRKGGRGQVGFRSRISDQEVS